MVADVVVTGAAAGGFMIGLAATSTLELWAFRHRAEPLFQADRTQQARPADAHGSRRCEW